MRLQETQSLRKGRIIHPLFIRVTHWINAFAVFVMLMSGWRIFNAAPLFNMRFPPEMTLGGWLAGALAWHFAAMWLLAVNGLAYIAYGLLTGHFWRHFVVIRPITAYRNLRLELKHLLMHGTGEYNPVQRLLYLGVIWIMITLVLSGLAMWKPVQLQELAAFFGGYERARWVHFYAMTALVVFMVIHIGVALAVKGTVRSMFTGRLETHVDREAER